MSVTLGKTTIPNGKSDIVNFYVGRIPSGNKLFIKSYAYCGKEEGETLLITAGIHGDEVNGMEMVRRCLENGLFDRVVKGNVIVIPVVNVYGFNYLSREVPDGKDVNRSFPGNMKGSLGSRMARIISRNFLPVIDYGLDLHTGSGDRYNYPQIRVTKGDLKAIKLAADFGCESLLQNTVIQKSLRQAAKKLNKPILIFEAGESRRLNQEVVLYGMDRIEQFLINRGFVEGEKVHLPEIKVFNKSSWTRATDSGIFDAIVQSGFEVRKNQFLGSIHNSFNQTQQLIKSPRDAFVLGHQNSPVVHPGDALFHLAYEPTIIQNENL